jgi:hypothetical protein
MNSIIQQHSLQDASAASVAPTPARKSVMDFFQKIPTDEHIKIQDALMSDLTQAAIMDLRSVQVRAKKQNVVRAAKKICVVNRSTNDHEGSFH